MYFVYIIKSKIDDSLYIGYTQDLAIRLRKHNTAKSGYTSRKKPWIVVYTEQFNDKFPAIKREIFLKEQKNRNFYDSLIESWSGSSVG
ncbi:MAG: excinuclease ABC subunit C [Bacteroidetes bacterium]|nr:MAG: excinuclease ABC subunit C [Bacteroidota bacterium]